MDVCSIEGNFKCGTKEELSRRIRHSASLPLDDIWIGGENKYPCLAILVNGHHACVHYFEEEGVMWQSRGDFSEAVVFLAGGEEWSAPADTIVSLESAVSCAEEFFDSGKRPGCIRWQSL